ncbi:hypothetical protein P378_07285 [Desulforamulus profundi]|uniref:Uncharacterized protein n=1 Tax=Desulforamulus profundi TaxID=1383067 RepID=A0A2C6MGH4_9FIRM|nr:hypothetical protein [Desulforamulus profundi]MCL4440644.1 hypothetical protein [Bacillota bacterium]MCL5780332.1 hypothetical protein [Bacillota bacterium]PHJ38794.1 hypothetical protein P378_07285 [Desulforamulus profundi]
MVDINTEGLEIAPLSEEQINALNNVQAQLNEMAKIDQEIYLLAVTRNEGAK